MTDPRTKRALESAAAALELAIDAREMTAAEFRRKYERELRPGWITPALRKALGKVGRAMK